MEKILWDNGTYFAEKDGDRVNIVHKKKREIAAMIKPKFMEAVKEFLDDANPEDDLERVKEIADANTLYPHEAAQMPHYSIMTIRDFYGPDDEKKHEGGVYDRENVVYFRFDFSKLEALFEIWSREGKLLHTELWGPREFNYEEFTGMVGDGAEWVVRSSDTGEKVARFSYSPENRYTAHIGDELHHLDDEVEMMEIMEEHLGGIRTVCCHCMDGCAQCDGLGFRIEKIEEVDEDAV